MNMNRNKKNIIHLTESELKTIIKEEILNIISERKIAYPTTTVYIDLFNIDIEDESLCEYLDNIDEDCPNEVAVTIEYEIIPYSPGDYWTPPEGGYADLIDCHIDSNNNFKNILPPELFEIFKQSVNEYLDKHGETYLEEIYDDYANYEPEYEPDYK